MRQDYKTEFSDFDFDIPHIDGFTDKSWHNDVCPSFERKYNETHSVVLWVNYSNEDRRECGGKQFIVAITPTDDDYYVEPIDIIETDSWNDVIEAINKLFKEAK
jgi:hypothetical protein